VGEEPESSVLPKLVSVPVLVVVAVLGFAVIVLARLFGPQNVLREVVTEVVASFGSTILVLAIFGLLFRTGLERLLRGAPGGEAFMDLKTRGSGYEAKLDRIEEDISSMADDELPALRNEIAELRKLLASPKHERDG
jgi:hypothetical protein